MTTTITQNLPSNLGASDVTLCEEPTSSFFSFEGYTPKKTEKIEEKEKTEEKVQVEEEKEKEKIEKEAELKSLGNMMTSRKLPIPITPSPTDNTPESNAAYVLFQMKLQRPLETTFKNYFEYRYRNDGMSNYNYNCGYNNSYYPQNNYKPHYLPSSPISGFQDDDASAHDMDMEGAQDLFRLAKNYNNTNRNNDTHKLKRKYIRKQQQQQQKQQKEKKDKYIKGSQNESFSNISGSLSEVKSPIIIVDEYLLNFSETTKSTPNSIDSSNKNSSTVTNENLHQNTQNTIEREKSTYSSAKPHIIWKLDKKTKKSSSVGSKLRDSDSKDKEQVVPFINHFKPDRKTHACNMCDNVFKRKEHLKRHQLTHTGEKPFSCRVCGKSFSRIDNLSQHSRLHSKNRSSSPPSFTYSNILTNYNQQNLVEGASYSRLGSGNEKMEDVIEVSMN